MKGKLLFAARVLAAAFLLCTDASAQKAEDVTVPLAGGREMAAHLYAPEGAGPWPGVLVMPTMASVVRGQAESFDREYAQALAKEGYVTLTAAFVHPSLASRPHQPGTLEDIAAAARWLKARPEVKGGPLGAVGFSLGSIQAPRVSAQEPGLFQAIVGYYGLYNFETHPIRERLKGGLPPDPVKLAGKVDAPVLILHGEADDETRIDQAADFEKALKAAGKKVKLVVYPGAFHRFDRGPTEGSQSERSRDGHTYRLDAKARDGAWRQTLAWLKEHLK